MEVYVDPLVPASEQYVFNQQDFVTPDEVYSSSGNSGSIGGGSGVVQPVNLDAYLLRSGDSMFGELNASAGIKTW